MSTGRKVYYMRIQVLLVDGGTIVLRRLFDEKSKCLNQTKGTLMQLSRKGVINKQQVSLLLSNNPTSMFDISLLNCLLRNICGLRSSNDPCWSSPPGPTDFSIEADLVRLRDYRNEFAHIHLTSALSENDFNMKWTDIVKVLLRLDTHLQNRVPNLQVELDKMKSIPLDEEADESYRQEIEKWQEMDEALTRDTEIIASQMKDLNINVQTLTTEISKQQAEMSKKITKNQDEVMKHMNTISQTQSSREMSAEQKNLHDSAQMYFDDASRNRAYYVKTNVYNDVSKKLQTSGVAILSGHPGEGKSSMATYLLMEMSQVHKILRLARPDDWRLVNFDFYTSVLIDDIFGNAVLDENLLGKWEVFFTDIVNATKLRKLSFVITSRHYIMQEAQVKLQNRYEMFKEENITILSSSKLNSKEKYNILESHLKKNKREIQTDLYNYQSVETQWKMVTSKSNKIISIGFPECASMFACSDFLFGKGIDFFSSPLEFFQKCIQEISLTEDEFMPLVLVWLKTSGKLAIKDFDNGDKRKQLQELGEEFHYPFHRKSRDIKKCLERHKDEFLAFSTKTGEYSFSHSVISDVVGIVCAREYADAVLKHASKDFVMKYVKTSHCIQDDLLIHIEEYQFRELIERLYQIMFEDDDVSQKLLSKMNICIKFRGIENTRLFSDSPTDIFVLKHEAFENAEFIKKLVEKDQEKGRKEYGLDTPLVDAFEIFKAKFCIIFHDNKMRMCLPSTLLALNKDLLVNECLKKSVLNENEKYMSLLLATRERNTELVKKLFCNGITTNEDALQIATVNKDLEILELLLQNQNGSDFSSHIQHGNSPLITAAKRGYISSAKCLLEYGVDVNYRNKSNVSALDKATISHNVKMCQLLLKYGAAVNNKGGRFQRTPLHTATDMGHTDLVHLFLNHGADVNIRDYRNDFPCQSATIFGHAEILKEILLKDISSGASKMCHSLKQISKGMSLYHIAVIKENERILKVLKNVGINPNMKDKYGRTPLYIAVVYGKTSLVRMLLDVADPNLPEKNGYTPLHAAVYKNDLKNVKLLCQQQKLLVNKQDKRGITPLHLACKTANYKIIVELLNVRQIDVRMITKRGQTVHDMLKAAVKDARLQITSEKLSMCKNAIRKKDLFSAHNKNM